MFNVIRLLKDRNAGRAIKTDALDMETMEYLTEAARLTPSCYNKQPWRFLFISGSSLEKGREALVAPNREWADRAPLLVVGYSKEEDDCKLKDGRAYHQFDLGMSVMNLMLAATEKELVARPMAGFDPQKIIDNFKLDEDYIPMIVIAIGKPDTDESYLPERLQGLGESKRERNEINDFVMWLID